MASLSDSCHLVFASCYMASSVMQLVFACGFVVACGCLWLLVFASGRLWLLVVACGWLLVVLGVIILPGG